MDKHLDEMLEKVKGIKQEMDKIEFKVMNTKTHIDNVEHTMERIGKEVIEGFHIVSTKVNNLEKEMKIIEALLIEIKKK